MDIIVCGSNTVDAFLQTDAELVTFESQEHGHRLVAYPLGKKVSVEHLEFHIGGGGTNALATLTAQGLECGYVGRVGKDTNGHKVFEWLQERGVAFLGQAGGETGFSVILDSQADDRTILMHKGANDHLMFDEIPQHRLRTTWFYGSAMRGESQEALEKLFRFMHNHGTLTAHNPNNAMCEQGLSSLRGILECVDVLVLNKEEAELLIGKGDPAGLARRLTEQGPRVVAVTNGSEGVTVHVKDWDGQDSFHVEAAKKLDIVETTGAGDAFASGLVAGLARERPVRDAVLCGVLNAEKVIQSYGAKSVLGQDELERQLAEERKNPRHRVS